MQRVSMSICLTLGTGAAGQAMPAKGSNLDDKIQQRVQARKARGANKYTPEVHWQHAMNF